jgi:hypothetical protein
MSHQANDELRENKYENRVDQVGAVPGMYPARKYYILLGANGAYNVLPGRLQLSQARDLLYQIDGWLMHYCQIFGYSPLDEAYTHQQIKPVLVRWNDSKANKGERYWQEITHLGHPRQYEEVVDFIHDHLRRKDKDGPES